MPTAAVTDQQLRALRTEAVRAGDYRQVDICDVALGVRPQHTATDRGSIKDSRGKSMTRAKARSVCAEVISYAQAEARHARHHTTMKRPAQLDREIAATLVPHSAKGDRVLTDLKSWGIDRAQLAEVREAFRTGAHGRAMELARDLGWNRASKRGRAFR